MEKAPVFGSNQFKCPHCNVLAQQEWFDSRIANKAVNGIIARLYFEYRIKIQDYQQKAIASFIEVLQGCMERDLQGLIPQKLSIANCTACREVSLWVDRHLVFPKKSSLAPPNGDMDDDIKELYHEAAVIFLDSPKGATALLRLALQKLLKQVGKSGKNINDDIKGLVAEGLSPKIQQALDIVRVVGNNAVHPGQINLDDSSDIALRLFAILNFIADEIITKPKELAQLYSDIVPAETQEHIKQRDGN